MLPTGRRTTRTLRGAPERITPPSPPTPPTVPESAAGRPAGAARSSSETAGPLNRWRSSRASTSSPGHARPAVRDAAASHGRGLPGRRSRCTWPRPCARRWSAFCATNPARSGPTTAAPGARPLRWTPRARFRPAGGGTPWPTKIEQPASWTDPPEERRRAARCTGGRGRPAHTDKLTLRARCAIMPDPESPETRAVTAELKKELVSRTPSTTRGDTGRPAAVVPDARHAPPGTATEVLPADRADRLAKCRTAVRSIRSGSEWR